MPLQLRLLRVLALIVVVLQLVRPFFLMASQAACGSNASGFVEIDSYVRGYHAYQDIWTPFRGEVLQLKWEPDNSVDQNAVAVVKIDGSVVGRVPYNSAPTFLNF